jgi:hypothetical protein
MKDDLALGTKKMCKYRGGPGALVGDAKGLSDYRPLTVSQAAAQINREQFNKGRRSGRLDPF